MGLFGVFLKLKIYVVKQIFDWADAHGDLYVINITLIWFVLNPVTIPEEFSYAHVIWVVWDSHINKPHFKLRQLDLFSYERQALTYYDRCESARDGVDMRVVKRELQCWLWTHPINTRVDHQITSLLQFKVKIKSKYLQDILVFEIIYRNAMNRIWDSLLDSFNTVT